MEDNKLETIYERLIAGDELARNELIEAAVPLVKAIAKAKAYRESDRDDCEGEALLAVVECIKRLPRKPRVDIRRCIMGEARHAVFDALRELPVVGPCARTLRSQGGDCKPLKVWSLLDDGNDGEPDDALPELETTLDVLGCCETDRERELVRLRAEGKTFQQAAASVGVTHPTAIADIRRVEARYNEALAA
jgi:DNA-directed RNA polymerase specialized sigma24 family protein